MIIDIRCRISHESLSHSIEYLTLYLTSSFICQAKEVHQHNPWLTYGIGLHRIREAGLGTNIMEYIDQRPLTLTEVYEWCSAVFVADNDSFLTMRDPNKDWYGFLEDLQVLLREEAEVFNPIKNDLSPWIDVDVLQARYEAKAQTPSNKVPYKRSSSLPQESHANARSEVPRTKSPVLSDERVYRRASTTTSAMPTVLSNERAHRRASTTSAAVQPQSTKPHRRASVSSGLRASMSSGVSPSTKPRPDLRKSFSAYNPSLNSPQVRQSPSPNTTTFTPDVQGFGQSFSGNMPHMAPPLPIRTRRSSQPKLSQSFRLARDPPPATFMPPPPRRLSSVLPSRDDNSVIAKYELQKSLFGVKGSNKTKEQNIATFVKNWAHEGSKLRPLPTLLFEVSVLLSPENPFIEYPEYFDKWKIVHRDEFKDDTGSVDDQLVSKIAKKCKLFLHPDKWPQDLDDDQKLLLQSIWDVFQESALF